MADLYTAEVTTSMLIIFCQWIFFNSKQIVLFYNIQQDLKVTKQLEDIFDLLVLINIIIPLLFRCHYLALSKADYII